MTDSEQTNEAELAERVQHLEAELERAQAASRTWVELAVMIVGAVLLIVFFVPAVTLFLVLLGIGACMRVLDRAFGASEPVGEG